MNYYEQNWHLKNTNPCQGHVPSIYPSGHFKSDSQWPFSHLLPAIAKEQQKNDTKIANNFAQNSMLANHKVT